MRRTGRRGRRPGGWSRKRHPRRRPWTWPGGVDQARSLRTHLTPAQLAGCLEQAVRRPSAWGASSAPPQSRWRAAQGVTSFLRAGGSNPGDPGFVPARWGDMSAGSFGMPAHCMWCVVAGCPGCLHTAWADPRRGWPRQGVFCCVALASLPSVFAQAGQTYVIDPTRPASYPAYPAPACETPLGVAAIVLSQCNLTGQVRRAACPHPAWGFGLAHRAACCAAARPERPGAQPRGEHSSQGARRCLLQARLTSALRCDVQVLDLSGMAPCLLSAVPVGPVPGCACETAQG